MTMTMPQVAELTSNWWALALRGAVSILLGLVAFTMPGLTIAALVTIFGVYVFIQGVLAIAAAIRGIKEHDRWGWMLIEGIVCIFAGVVAFVVPSAGALALVWLVAAWAIAAGVLEIAAGIRLRKMIEGEWMLILAGVLALVLGVYIMSRPGVGVLLLATWLGVYAIFAGIITLLLAFRIRNWAHDHA
ncbi:MAG: HdeD family acid-resistance protein [Gemmatimonadetes bacterium]|nr:HdeD family acid-resistance protein [Gemmatimonadota bacterium]